MTAAGLHVEVMVGRGGFTLDVTFDVRPGEVLALLGPNGSGKSTLLGVLAGTLRPDRGVVRLDGRVLTDTGQRVLLPPHRRRVGLLAQTPLLFPHLSVLDNVAFGPRCAGARRGAARVAARRALSDVDAVRFAGRKPDRLSGGQAQRVALARALAAEPDLLLLDEPLSAVDVDLAPQLRALLRTLLADRLAVVVTHQVLDALVLADRVVVLDGGRIAEQGPTMTVLTRPRSAFAAKLAGLNLIRGTALAGGLRTADGIEICCAATATVTAAEAGPLPGAPAVAVFSPTDVAVHLRPPQGSPRNVLPGVVRGLEPQGTLVRVRAENGIAADVTATSAAELALHPGQRVWFVVKATEVAVHALPHHEPGLAPGGLRSAADRSADLAGQPKPGR